MWVKGLTSFNEICFSCFTYTVEAWVKRVKDVGNEEEASEGASNGAIVASLRRSVGEHARVQPSESNNPEQKKKISWKKTAQQKLL